MSFFEPEDFEEFTRAMAFSDIRVMGADIADAANAKINHYGKVIHGRYDGENFYYPHAKPSIVDTHKALLIAIEPIEKCKHPEEKIRIQIREGYNLTTGSKLPLFIDECYLCECGATVKPTQFEEIE